MTSPVFRPNQPVSPSWSPAGGWYAAGQRDQQQQSGQMSADDLRKWDMQINEIKQALAASSGWEREKKQLELEDAEKGRQNAYRIAEIQDRTSRYGIDERSRIELKQLWENQRQFDANHDLERQKFGLSVADSYAKFASGPDMMFLQKDFMNGMERVGQGLGVQSYGAGGQQPRARTWGDFAALSGYDNMPSVQANQSGGGARQSGGGGADANGDGVPDQRIKAVRGIVDAIPPSDTDGTDGNDWAALDAIEAVFRARKPNAYNKMRGGQQKGFAAGLSRRGYYAPDAIEDMQRAGIGQGSARAA